jgi:hypothetical protein
MAKAKNVTGRSEEEGAALVRRWKASGLSQTQFGREQGIAPHVISYWKRRLEHRPKREPPAFVLLSGDAKAGSICCSDDVAQCIEVWFDEKIRLKLPFGRAELGPIVATLKEALS